jgi:hypothetical protein
VIARWILPIALLAAATAEAGMQAPVAVGADASGHFEYDWIFVFEYAMPTMAGFGASNSANTTGTTHGDCFCLGFPCSGEVGDTLRWHVTGKLIDLNHDGRVRNWVAGCDTGGGSSYTIIVSRNTAVDDAAALAGLRLSSQPNPCRDRARFDFDLPRSGRVSLELLDVGGRRVAKLVDDVRPAGSHSVEWRVPRSAESSPRCGVYFARLQFEGTRRIRRVLVVD